MQWVSLAEQVLQLDEQFKHFEFRKYYDDVQGMQLLLVSSS